MQWRTGEADALQWQRVSYRGGGPAPDLQGGVAVVSLMPCKCHASLSCGHTKPGMENKEVQFHVIKLTTYKSVKSK